MGEVFLYVSGQIRGMYLKSWHAVCYKEKCASENQDPVRGRPGKNNKRRQE